MKQLWVAILLVILVSYAMLPIAFAQDAPAIETATEQPGDDEAAAEKGVIEPAPITYALPKSLAAADIPNDKGQSIQITWTEPQITDLDVIASTLVIWRRAPGESQWQQIGDSTTQSGRYVDTFAAAKKDKPAHLVEDGVTYQYKASVKEAPQMESEVFSGSPKGHWFHTGRTVALIATIVYILLVVFFIRYARSGKKMFVRPISGIDAVEEAVGRATEMGKPVLYVPGIGEVQEVATLAALTILAPIAEKVAEYDTPLLVPNRDPIVYTVAQEVVREAYVKVGRPDAYKEDNIYFLSGRQFAYAAAVSGMMMRDKPATNFFFGMFYAESLILAETGAAIGAIQIAGTDQVAQLPFFIATCDYTLIGEELYAASAYLSHDPVLVGSLKALDWMKVALLAVLAVSLVGSLLGWTWLAKVLGG